MKAPSDLNNNDQAPQDFSVRHPSLSGTGFSMSFLGKDTVVLFARLHFFQEVVRFSLLLLPPMENGIM